MKSLIAAFQFLTRIPLSGRDSDLGSLGSSSAWFPLVGLFIGGLMAGCSWLLVGVFPASVVAALLIAVSILVTGGLHIDGLMDSADGLMVVRDREKTLEIMRDSRVGAMGAIAAVVVILIKWTLITAVLDSGDHGLILAALLLTPVLGRWAMVIGLFLFPYARSENGLGKVFAAGTGRLQLVAASLITLAAAWLLCKTVGLLTLLGVLLITAAVSYGVSKRIGGLTGDTYGALEELGEVVSLLLIFGLKCLF